MMLFHDPINFIHELPVNVFYQSVFSVKEICSVGEDLLLIYTGVSSVVKWANKTCNTPGQAIVQTTRYDDLGVLIIKYDGTPRTPFRKQSDFS